MSKSMQYELARIFDCSVDDPRIVEFLRTAVSEAHKYQPFYYDSKSLEWKQGYNSGKGEILVHYRYHDPDERHAFTLDVADQSTPPTTEEKGSSDV